MTYKDSLVSAMGLLAQDPKRIFVGYNVSHGSQANGTLTQVPKSQLLEMPVAENLMAGLALGMSLEGYKPVVYVERFDFILNALDAIVNHVDKLATLSRGQFQPQVLFRVVVGSRLQPLFSGPTHTQDLTTALRQLVTFPVITANHPLKAWRQALAYATSAMVVEYRELYPTELQDD